MHGNYYNLQRSKIIQRMNINPYLKRSSEAQEEVTRFIPVLFGSQKVTNNVLQFPFCRSTNSPRRHKAIAEPISVPLFPGISFSSLTSALCVCIQLCNEGHGFCKISLLPRTEEIRHGFSPFMWVLAQAFGFHPALVFPMCICTQFYSVLSTSTSGINQKTSVLQAFPVM